MPSEQEQRELIRRIVNDHNYVRLTPEEVASMEEEHQRDLQEEASIPTPVRNVSPIVSRMDAVMEALGGVRGVAPSGVASNMHSGTSVGRSIRTPLLPLQNSPADLSSSSWSEMAYRSLVNMASAGLRNGAPDPVTVGPSRSVPSLARLSLTAAMSASARYPGLPMLAQIQLGSGSMGLPPLAQVWSGPLPSLEMPNLFEVLSRTMPLSSLRSQAEELSRIMPLSALPTQAEVLAAASSMNFSDFPIQLQVLSALRFGIPAMQRQLVQTSGSTRLPFTRPYSVQDSGSVPSQVMQPLSEERSGSMHSTAMPPLSEEHSGSMPTPVMTPRPAEPLPREYTTDDNVTITELGAEYGYWWDGQQRIPIVEEREYEVHDRIGEFRCDVEMLTTWSIDHVEIMHDAHFRSFRRQTDDITVTPVFGGYSNPAAQEIQDAITHHLLNPGQRGPL